MRIKKTKLEIQQDKLISKFLNKKRKKKKRKKKKVDKSKQHKTKEQYYKELKNPKWFKRREEILKLDDNTCCYCETKDNLQVHHKEYLGNMKAWEYTDKLLITVCKSCHESIHKLRI